MVETILITLLIVAISLVLLGVKVFFTKGGKFPNGHVSGNKALRQKGIGCAQSQDREAQKKPRFSINELEKALKNERKAEAGELCVSSISVDCATTLKRMRPAPQGRGYRIRKRSNHVTLFVDTLSKNDSQN